MGIREVLFAEIYRDKAYCWRYRIRAGNNEIVATSEPYFSKWNAKRAVRRLYPDAEIEIVK